MTSKKPDFVYRRVVIEFGFLYAYCYFTDGNGKVIDEESFRQPYRLDRKEAVEESKDLYDLVWQHLSDTVNAVPLQDTDDDESESEEED